jgi:hypothetical protein
MPRAEMSLEDRLAAVDQASDQAEGIDILIDVATALESLHSRVVHRDFNSGNVLLYQGDWCLTDFGISRYAVATTDLATRKCSLTPAYAAPEQWHHGRDRCLRLRCRRFPDSERAAPVQRVERYGATVPSTRVNDPKRDRQKNGVQRSRTPRVTPSSRSLPSCVMPSWRTRPRHSTERGAHRGRSRWKTPSWPSRGACGRRLIPGALGKEASVALMWSLTRHAKDLNISLVSQFQVDWPFTRLTVGDLGEFIDRWVGWFGDAAAEHPRFPNKLPERR